MKKQGQYWSVRLLKQWWRNNT